MASSQLRETWDPLVDKLIFAVWSGKEKEAIRALRPLQKALKQAEMQKSLDAQLEGALNRVAAFYCLERRFDECQVLLTALERACKRNGIKSALKKEQILEITKHIHTLQHLSILNKDEFFERASQCARLDQHW